MSKYLYNITNINDKNIAIGAICTTYDLSLGFRKTLEEALNRYLTLTTDPEYKLYSSENLHIIKLTCYDPVQDPYTHEKRLIDAYKVEKLYTPTDIKRLLLLR